MTERPAITLDDVLATARMIVNHKPSRGAIGVSVEQVVAMAHSLCGLDDVARLSAEFLRAKPSAPSVADEVRLELISTLGALGYLTLVEQEATDGQEG